MASTRTSSGGVSFRHHLLDRPAVRGGGRLPFVLSTGLAASAVVAAGTGLLLPDRLGGEAVMRGNLRGTAIVMLVLALPLLVTAMVRSAQNSARWLLVWLGTVAYLTYQGVMFLFATPFNNFFLVYVALLGFGIWSLIALVSHVQLDGLSARTDPRMRWRLIGSVCVALASLNAVAWFMMIAPTVWSDDPQSVLDGSGLLTNPVWAQDLAFWVPAGIVAGTWMWRRRPLGVLVAGGYLVFSVVESVSVAVDQWWGVRADDSQPDWASMTVVPMFLVVALLTAVPLVLHLRNLDRH